MAQIVAGSRDSEERPGSVGRTNWEEGLEAELHEDRTRSTELGSVVVEGENHPATERMFGMWQHGHSEPRGSSIRNGGRIGESRAQEEVKEIHRSMKQREDETEGNNQSRVWKKGQGFLRWTR
jgi:hypothetical protein